MGKKRVTQLLEQLKDNQQQELQNAAAIYTVAQVAVNELRAQEQESDSRAVTVLPPATSALPPAPILISKTDLLQRYGSYNACRKAASTQGIRFSRTPSWYQLTAAFSYFESFQQLIASYMTAHPNPELSGVSFELTLD